MSDLTEVAKRAIEQAGGLRIVSRQFRISPQSVQIWTIRGIPPQRCADMERLSGIPREELRPDVFK